MEVKNKQSKNYIVESLAKLKTLPGWKFLVDEFDNKLKQCEEEIFNLIGGNEKIYTKNDLLKLERKNILDLIEYPTNKISSLTDDKKIKEEELDPYEDGAGRAEEPELEPED